MAVRLVHVDVLELRRGGQHEVGVVGGVGLEVFEHDGEEILAREARRDFARLRRDGDRVAVVDDQRIDRRIGMQQVVADRRHVDRARRAAIQELGTVEPRCVDRIVAAGRQQHPAGRIAPVTGERRQAGHRSHRVAAAGRALHAVVQADGCRAGSPSSRVRTARPLLR